MLQFKYKSLPCDLEIATWVCDKWDVQVEDYDGDDCSYRIRHNGTVLEQKENLAEDFHKVCEIASIRFNELFIKHKSNT